jgi:hypothetical protein
LHVCVVVLRAPGAVDEALHHLRSHLGPQIDDGPEQSRGPHRPYHEQVRTELVNRRQGVALRFADLANDIP